jgi:hypothetical protein
MMAMLGWTDPKMPAHYKAKREKLGITGMDKIVAYDQSQSLNDFLTSPEENTARTPAENKVVTLRSILRKYVASANAYAWVWCARRDSNPHPVTDCHLKAARLPIPPRALVATGPGTSQAGSTARDVTNQRWADKALCEAL